MTVGDQLRASREAKGLSLDALAHTTRVQTRYLAAIERNDVASVPPRPFGRGFVRAYAKEIGLDPERTAHDYFAQFAPLPTSSAPPTIPLAPPQDTRTTFIPNWVALSALAVLVVALGTITIRRSDRANHTTPAPAPAVGTTGRATETPVATETREKSPARDIALPVAAPEHALIVQLTPTRRCWVTASADGKRVIYKLMMPGPPETLNADREIQIMAGDAGALEWTINGRKIGPFGESGQIRTQRVTPDSADSIR
jgi:cytoskeleton protein RodZ